MCMCSVQYILHSIYIIKYLCSATEEKYEEELDLIYFRQISQYTNPAYNESMAAVIVVTLFTLLLSS